MFRLPFSPLTAPFARRALRLCLLAVFVAHPLAAQVSVLPLRGEVSIDRGGERPERIRELTPLRPGESVLTASASTAVLLFPSGSRLSLQSEGSVTFSPEASTASASEAPVPLLILREGFVATRVPREAAPEGLHIRTDAGTFVTELGTSAINVLSDRSGQRVVMVGVESGRMRLVPQWEGGSELSIFQGDAFTLSRLPATADDPPPQIQEQILVGELRSRLMSSLEDIESGQAEVAGSRQRGRPTLAVTSLPRADQLPRPYPATGRLPPEWLLR